MKPPTKEPVLGADQTEKNAINLPESAAKELTQVLDQLTSSLFVQFHQYQKHHWMVEGPQWRDLHLYLEEAYKQVHLDLDELAERMTILGGVPTSGPAAQQKLSFVSHEPEGMFKARDMITADLENEKTLATEFRKAIKKARGHDDFGTESLLKRLLFNVEDRAHHLDHYLSGDSLEDGR